MSENIHKYYENIDKTIKMYERFDDYKHIKQLKDIKDINDIKDIKDIKLKKIIKQKKYHMRILIALDTYLSKININNEHKISKYYIYKYYYYTPKYYTNIHALLYQIFEKIIDYFDIVAKLQQYSYFLDDDIILFYKIIYIKLILILYSYYFYCNIIFDFYKAFTTDFTNQENIYTEDDFNTRFNNYLITKFNIPNSEQHNINKFMFKAILYNFIEYLKLEITDYEKNNIYSIFVKNLPNDFKFISSLISTNVIPIIMEFNSHIQSNLSNNVYDKIVIFIMRYIIKFINYSRDKNKHVKVNILDIDTIPNNKDELLEIFKLEVKDDNSINAYILNIQQYEKSNAIIIGIANVYTKEINEIGLDKGPTELYVHIYNCIKKTLENKLMSYYDILYIFQIFLLYKSYLVLCTIIYNNIFSIWNEFSGFDNEHRLQQINFILSNKQIFINKIINQLKVNDTNISKYNIDTIQKYIYYTIYNELIKLKLFEESITISMFLNNIDNLQHILDNYILKIKTDILEQHINNLRINNRSISQHIFTLLLIIKNYVNSKKETKEEKQKQKEEEVITLPVQKHKMEAIHTSITPSELSQVEKDETPIYHPVQKHKIALINNTSKTQSNISQVEKDETPMYHRKNNVLTTISPQYTELSYVDNDDIERIIDYRIYGKIISKLTFNSSSYPDSMNIDDKYYKYLAFISLLAFQNDLIDDIIYIYNSNSIDRIEPLKIFTIIFTIIKTSFFKDFHISSITKYNIKYMLLHIFIIYCTYYIYSIDIYEMIHEEPSTENRKTFNFTNVETYQINKRNKVLESISNGVFTAQTYIHEQIYKYLIDNKIITHITFEKILQDSDIYSLTYQSFKNVLDRYISKINIRNLETLIDKMKASNNVLSEVLVILKYICNDNVIHVSIKNETWNQFHPNSYTNYQITSLPFIIGGSKTINNRYKSTHKKVNIMNNEKIIERIIHVDNNKNTFIKLNKEYLQLSTFKFNKKNKYYYNK